MSMCDPALKKENHIFNLKKMDVANCLSHKFTKIYVQNICILDTQKEKHVELDLACMFSNL
jgi:hypothetical protein